MSYKTQSAQSSHLPDFSSKTPL